MPIPVTCECGRTLKLKDEMAGKKGRCPSCQTILYIPGPPEEDEDQLEYVQAVPEPPRTKPKPPGRFSDEEDDEDDRPSRRRRRDDDEDDRPSRRSRRDYDDEERPRRRPDRDDDDDRPSRRSRDSGSRGFVRDDVPSIRKSDRPRRRNQASGGFGGVNGGAMVTGILMMVGAVVWFVGGLAVNILFYYPPVLFVLGIIAFFKGLLGRSE